MVHPIPEGALVRACIISGADGLMVIDPGSPGTHFHFDHIGGIGRLLGVRTLK